MPGGGWMVCFVENCGRSTFSEDHNRFLGILPWVLGFAGEHTWLNCPVWLSLFAESLIFFTLIAVGDLIRHDASQKKKKKKRGLNGCDHHRKCNPRATPIPRSQHDPLKPPFKSNPLFFFFVIGFIQSIPWGSSPHSSAGLIHCWSSVASEQQMAPLGFLKENYYNEVDERRM